MVPEPWSGGSTRPMEGGGPWLSPNLTHPGTPLFFHHPTPFHIQASLSWGAGSIPEDTEGHGIITLISLCGDLSPALGRGCIFLGVTALLTRLGLCVLCTLGTWTVPHSSFRQGGPCPGAYLRE